VHGTHAHDRAFSQPGATKGPKPRNLHNAPLRSSFPFELRRITMSIQSRSTLRLNMPQWQGGNQPEYHFGAQLLAWLAPAAEGPVETVSVREPEPGETLRLENGMRARSAVVHQAREARQAIDKRLPARIVTPGGDCLVDLAPIAPT
jgi:arginase family enzyme